MSVTLNLAKYHLCLESLQPIQAQGNVTQVVGLVVESCGPACRLGAVCDIVTREGGRRLAAEALGFRDQRVLLMPLEEIRGIAPGCRVIARQQKATVRVGRALLGRVIDGLGDPIDEQGPLAATEEYSLYSPPSTRCSADGSTSPWTSGCGPSTDCSRWDAASASVSLPARGWAKVFCSA
jgi:flagellum-specific ATP synthase